jgi:outer membrane protein assembly factor BamB
VAATQQPGGGAQPPVPPDDDQTPQDGSGLTRRQLLPRVGGGVAALAVAGVIGYELHPDAKTAPAPKPKPKPKPTTQPATPQTTLDRPFISRPDLSPPPIKITQVGSGAGSETKPRFIALAPDNVIQNGTPYQQGLMLVDRLGRLVWFEPAAQGKPFDLKVQTYKGKPVLTWWEGGLIADFGSGKAQIADKTFNTIKTVSAGNGLTMDLHEFTITPDGDGLCTAYSETRADLRAIRGTAHGKIAACHAQVIDLQTGKATFDWNSLDHVTVEESYQIAPGKAKNLYDYFHMNSLQMLSDGSILISARNTWTVYKVNGKTGDVIWRMGGKKSDFKVEPKAHWAWQHHATLWSPTRMTLFDNSRVVGPLSRGLLLDVDESAMTVSLVQEYQNPAGFYAGTLGSVQLMPDDNVFVGWGTQPYFSEHASGGTLQMFGQLPPGVRSYRAFLVDIVGAPADKPVMIAKDYAAGGTVVFVSWNGATEIDSWRIDAGAHPKALKPVGSSPWAGFETSIVVDTEGPSFQAIALDADGNELGRSDVA